MGMAKPGDGCLRAFWVRVIFLLAAAALPQGAGGAWYALDRCGGRGTLCTAAAAKLRDAGVVGERCRGFAAGRWGFGGALVRPFMGAAAPIPLP